MQCLVKPVLCEVVYFAQSINGTQQRLIGEFKQALELIDHRYRQKSLVMSGVNIVGVSEKLTSRR